jgi:hypothetical protein
MAPLRRVKRRARKVAKPLNLRQQWPMQPAHAGHHIFGQHDFTTGCYQAPELLVLQPPRLTDRKTKADVWQDTGGGRAVLQVLLDFWSG